MAAITEELKAKAEVYYGDEMGQEKTKFLLQEVGLPSGLLPLRDIVECGHVVETGFVWLKQKNKVEHLFDKIGRKVSYATEITAYVEKSRIKKLTGVKAKELLLWLSLDEITADESPSGKITFKTASGLFKTFPRLAFEIEEEGKDKEKKKAGEEKKKAGDKVESPSLTLPPAEKASQVVPDNK